MSLLIFFLASIKINGKEISSPALVSSGQSLSVEQFRITVGLLGVNS